MATGATRHSPFGQHLVRTRRPVEDRYLVAWRTGQPRWTDVPALAFQVFAAKSVVEVAADGLLLQQDQERVEEEGAHHRPPSLVTRD